MNKSKKIVAAVAAIILFIVVGWYFLGERQHESQDVKLERAKGEKNESDNEKQAKVKERLTAIEESRKTLETDKKVSDGGQIESLKNALHC